MSYNGYRNWNQWNVALWLRNDERLWREMVHFIQYGRTKQKAVQLMMAWLKDQNIYETPDGAKYSMTAVRAAMVGM